MAILSEKRQKCFGLRRKDVRMRAIICDDDGRFAKKLEQLIMQYYRNMGMTIDTTVVTNPQNLLKRNDLANFDIAFLDADMKPIDGIEVGRALRKRKPKIIIVFVSAYLEFAPKGYTIDAFRYVLKQDIQNTLPLCLSDILQHFTPDRAFLTYKQRGEVFRIPCHDIMYIQSDLRKLNVFGDNSLEPIASFYGKLSEYTDLLSRQGFLQINKSTLVNMVHIKSFASYHVRLSNGVLKTTPPSKIVILNGGGRCDRHRYLELDLSIYSEFCRNVFVSQCVLRIPRATTDKKVCCL